MSADVEKMARMWSQGMSQSQIGLVMNLSASAVAGKIFRNRDLFPKRQQGQRTDMHHGKAGEPIVTASQKANERRKAFHAVKVAEEEKAAPVESVEPEIDGKEYDTARLPMAKDLMAIRDCECKWWVSDGPLMFCAEEVVAGKSWCAHHLKRSKGKGTISEQKAVTEAKRIAA